MRDQNCLQVEVRIFSTYERLSVRGLEMKAEENGKAAVALFHHIKGGRTIGLCGFKYYNFYCSCIDSLCIQMSGSLLKTGQCAVATVSNPRLQCMCTFCIVEKCGLPVNNKTNHVIAYHLKWTFFLL